MAEEETSAEASGGQPSCLTTGQHQQWWRAERSREAPVRELLFEIPSSRIVEENLGKYVLYEVVVLVSGRFDPVRASVERRYSDFVRLHQELDPEVREGLEGLALPPKLLTGNFLPDAIGRRRLALRAYLLRLAACGSVRRGGALTAFLTGAEQRRALALLRGGRYAAALALLSGVLAVQQRLAPWQSPALPVPTLAAMAVLHRDLGQPEQALGAARRALTPARRHGPRRYRLPLLQLMLELGQLLQPQDRVQLQDELYRLRDAERGEAAPQSLKELVIQEFL
ncbi:sorting nexin-20 isoform 1-T1 [Menidia menidia]